MIKQLLNWLFPTDSASNYDGAQWSAYTRGPTFKQGIGQLLGFVLLAVIFSVVVVVLF